MKGTNKNNNENKNFENGIFRNDCERDDGIDNSFEIGYTIHDGILYPDFVLPEQAHYPIGKYGSLRLAFIKEHRKGTYTTLLTQCRLNAYLHDIDTVAKEQVRLITAQFAKSRGIDENLKAADALEWVAQMNSCKLAAEEIVMDEVIHQ